MKFKKNYIIKNHIWVFIPARSGSKTIIDKNIKKLKGKPLISYTLNISKKLNFIQKIIFSSDSKKYHKIAENYAKIESHYRTLKTSQDLSSDLDVFKEYIVHKLNKKEKLPEFFLHLRPTTPLRKVSTINKVYKYFLENKKKFSSLRTVTRLENSGYRVVKIKKGRLFSLVYKSFALDQINIARQFFDDTYIPNGYADIIKTQNIFKNFLHGKAVGSFVIDEFNSDIDNIDEFKMTEKMLKY